MKYIYIYVPNGLRSVSYTHLTWFATKILQNKTITGNPDRQFSSAGLIILVIILILRLWETNFILTD